MSASTNEKFYTKDLVLATFLAYSGVKLCGGYDIEKQSWVFGSKERCCELSLMLRNNETNVEVLRYESIRRSLLGMANDAIKKGKTK